MKKLLLFFAWAISHFAMAQNLPVPIYQHQFSGTFLAPGFDIDVVGSNIYLTSDRFGAPASALALSNNHGYFKLNIAQYKNELIKEGTISMWFNVSTSTGPSGEFSDKALIFWSNGNPSYSEGIMFGRTPITQKMSLTSYENNSMGGNTTPGGNMTTTTNFPLGQWKHFTISWKFGLGGYMKAYVDGSLAATLNINHTLNNINTSDVIYFAGVSNLYPKTLSGLVDDVNVFKTALSDAQIASIYQYGVPTLCTVNIPDANFKTALLNHNPVIDTNGDGEIQCYEAAALTGMLFVPGRNISNLTGIRAFTNITTLNASQNQLTNIDLSANTALDYLQLDDNLLTSLDVSANTALGALYCQNNSLTNLDLSANTAFSALWARNNSLTSLDLSGNSNLINLDCSGNQLTALNIANGYNFNMVYFLSDNNPALTCIQVDDVNFSNVYWWQEEYYTKPANSSYSTDCSATMSTSDFNINKVSVFPNPVKDILNIVSDSDIKEIRVYNTVGQSQNIKRDNNKINLSNLQAGVYLLNIILTDNTNKSIKIIKH